MTILDKRLSTQNPSADDVMYSFPEGKREGKEDVRENRTDRTDRHTHGKRPEVSGDSVRREGSEGNPEGLRWIRRSLASVDQVPVALETEVQMGREGPEGGQGRKGGRKEGERKENEGTGKGEESKKGGRVTKKVEGGREEGTEDPTLYIKT